MSNVVVLRSKTRPCPLCKKVLPAHYEDYGDGISSWGVGYHECIDPNRERLKLFSQTDYYDKGINEEA